MTETYKNFTAAVYCTVYDVLKMKDREWLRSNFDRICTFIKVGKVFLETHRDTIVADEDTYTAAQAFFKERGIQVSGGITITINESNHFQTFCYTNPEHRENLKKIVAFTSRHNDEVILDDFFFTNCKCHSCVAAKGDRSWSQFRTELMAQAAVELVLEPARAANPNVKVIIKYPNWYEHFQGLGFNLEKQPALFDGLYTGTETRDPVASNQHLQAYHGYSIFRYFDNLKPGKNAGGWVDTGGMKTLDRFAEQFWITLFAKAPEVTIFNFSLLQQRVQFSDRAPWQGQGTSFDFDKLLAPYLSTLWTISPNTNAPYATVALAAGAAFEQVDAFYDRLGAPQGIPCYKPFHSTGEDFLHSYLGMVGLPIDLVPQFPTEAKLTLLTESAKHDPAIIEKIEAQLQAGKDVMITSGLLRALQDRGLKRIVEMEVTDRKALVQRFVMDWNRMYESDAPMLVSQIAYLTNDSWEEISCNAGVTGYPLLHFDRYASGTLWVLTVPDNFGDLYRLPAPVLDRIREKAQGDLWARLEGPSQVALYLYDNQTLIVESFLPEPVVVKVVTGGGFTRLSDVLTGEALTGEDKAPRRGRAVKEKAFSVVVKPHSFRVFKAE